MSAREVIAQTLFEFSGNGQGVDDMLAEIANAQTETIIDALTAAGYRILGPSELDAETVERCIKELNKLPWFEDVVSLVDVEDALRALAGSKDKEGRRE